MLVFVVYELFNVRWRDGFCSFDRFGRMFGWLPAKPFIGRPSSRSLSTAALAATHWRWTGRSRDKGGLEKRERERGREREREGQERKMIRTKIRKREKKKNPWQVFLSVSGSPKLWLLPPPFTGRRSLHTATLTKRPQKERRATNPAEATQVLRLSRG